MSLSDWAQLAGTLPTPVARSALRVARAGVHERVERFNCLTYLGETLIKYLATCLHASMTSDDRDLPWHSWGRDLSQASGVGTWEQHIGQYESLYRAIGSEDYFFDVSEWLVAKRTRPKYQTDWWGVAWESLCELVEKIGFVEQRFDETCRGVLSGFVFVRNKTRGHGAHGHQFYIELNSRLDPLLRSIIKSCPILDTDRYSLEWREQTAGGLMTARKLVGLAPSRHVSIDEPSASGLVLSTDGRAYPIAELLRYHPDSDRCLFANGQPGDDVEFIDYFDGQVERLPLPEAFAEAPEAPPSETAGSPQLRTTNGVEENLPRLLPHYVQRDELEERLRQLLVDPVNRVITLHGMGGVGKTTLALAVSHDLIKSGECPFNLIIWFSARDVDLMLSGPRATKREITDIEGVARFFGQLIGMESEKPVAEIREWTESLPILLVMDNFETLDDPEAVHEFLHNNVILPSKVLITSRQRAFQGDFAVRVRGMEFGQARELILRHARSLRSEPKFNAATIQRIYDYTSGVPYAMKLATSQIAQSDRPVHLVINEAVGEDRIVDALFTRSFAKLGEASQYLFLLVAGSAGQLSEHLARAILRTRSLSFDEAVEGCERLSLVSSTTHEGMPALEMPEVAVKFGRQEMATSRHHLSVEADLDILRTLKRQTLGEEGVVETSARALAALASSASGRTREEYESLLSSLAADNAYAAAVLAEHRADKGDVEGARTAFTSALKHEPNSRALWESWASVEGALGNELERAKKLIHAAEADPDDVDFNAWVSGVATDYMNRKGGGLSLRERRVLVDGLRRNLESRFMDLHPDQLSRLGWLCLFLEDFDASSRCVARAFELDGRHGYSSQLEQRLTHLGRSRRTPDHVKGL